MADVYLWKLLSVKSVNKKFGTEAKIQYEFVSLLRSLSIEGKLNCVWFAVSNETGRSDHASFGQTQKMLGKIAGTPDLVFLMKNGCGCIEFKAPKGKQSQNQKYFEMWCKDQGIDYRICYSKTEALEVLFEWGVIDRYENKSSWNKFN